MPNIRPVSDLRTYAPVLQSVEIGSPVYLTKNGRGAYAIVDITEFEELKKAKARLQLFRELEIGRLSGEEKGWISESDVKSHFMKKFNGE